MRLPGVRESLVLFEAVL
uniref:Uncharacterized protein n=1 Tax=Anguilla anguilla TaxID=7936 RepID=A0A0E9V580_ANGAN